MGGDVGKGGGVDGREQSMLDAVYRLISAMDSQKYSGTGKGGGRGEVGKGYRVTLEEK